MSLLTSEERKDQAIRRSMGLKHLIQYLSTIALVVGLLIACYAWQAQNIANYQAQEEARTYNQTSWSTPIIPVEDRALGLDFGFGLSFLGAFGLSVSLRMPPRLLE